MTPRLSIPASAAFEALAGASQFRDRIAIPVKASPDAIFQALDEVALPDMKLAWLLGEIRYVPARLTGHHVAGDVSRPFLSTLKENGTLELQDARPHEVIFGSAGQLHRVVDQTPVHFPNREAFDTFADPQYEKLFMSVRVTPTGLAGEQWLVLEHATLALSPEAAARFRKYWRAIKPMGAFVSRELLRGVAARAKRRAVQLRAG